MSPPWINIACLQLHKHTGNRNHDPLANLCLLSLPWIIKRSLQKKGGYSKVRSCLFCDNKVNNSDLLPGLGATVNISSKNLPAGDKVQLQHLLPHNLCLQMQVWNIEHVQELVYCSGPSPITTTHLGLVHLRVRWAIPPPQVREQGENSDQLDQEPCTTTEELSSSIKIQRPFKHHWKRWLLIIK